MLTNIVVIKAPLTTHVCTISHGLLLLPDSEIDLGPLSSLATLWRLEIDSVPIALVVAVDKNDHGKAIGDELSRSQSHGEGLRMGGNRDIGLDDSIAVLSGILGEGRGGSGPLYNADKIFKGRHGDP